MKSAAQAMNYETEGSLKAAKRGTQVSRKTMQRLNNDIDQMSTMEVLRRLYKRHNTGIWEALFIVTWVVILVSKFN